MAECGNCVELTNQVCEKEEELKMCYGIIEQRDKELSELR